MPQAGQTTDNGITLLKLVGRGSHSVVFLAFTPTGQPRAVKIFPKHLRHFADLEYQYALNLTHPNLAPVLSRTEIKGQPALVLHFVKGRMFFMRYQRRPAILHERRAFLQSLIDVLAGLDYMHEHGLVHRDVKPDNILVNAEGNAHLVDYDLVSPIDHASAVPMRVGTEFFQSPEAQRGESLGPEGDLYSIGVLLGWGLMGQLDDLEPEMLPSDERQLGELWNQLTHEDRRLRPDDASAVRVALQLELER